MREIFANSAFDAYRVAERLPGAEGQDDKAWEAYSRRTALLGYHPSNTNAAVMMIGERCTDFMFGEHP